MDLIKIPPELGDGTHESVADPTQINLAEIIARKLGDGETVTIEKTSMPRDEFLNLPDM